MTQLFVRRLPDVLQDSRDKYDKLQFHVVNNTALGPSVHTACQRCLQLVSYTLTVLKHTILHTSCTLMTLGSQFGICV